LEGTNLSKVFAFLLVEDDDVNRGAMSALLEKDGHRVTPASNGFQALEILGSGATFDYLLIDVHMPGIDGIETLKRWKNADRGDVKPIRIVALTADTRSETVERCREVGVDLVLPKPLRKRDLYALINNEGEFAMAGKSDYGMPPAEGLIDESYVAQLAGDIGVESFGTNIELFKRTGVEVNKELLQALEQGDIPGVKFWAHRLAGSCRMVGLAVLADSANRIEALTRDAAPADLLGEAIANFQSLYTESVRALDKWLEKARKHS
jgi:CheY-like chemotaxis protein